MHDIYYKLPTHIYFKCCGINSVQLHLSPSCGSAGEVFPAAVPERLTHVEASAHCTSLGGRLATVGQLYLSWRSGLDHCEPAWLSDGSVRFSVSSLRSDCPAGEPGVRMLSQTELNNGSMRFDAFCYRGMHRRVAQSCITQAIIILFSFFDLAHAINSFPVTSHTYRNELCSIDHQLFSLSLH